MLGRAFKTEDEEKEEEEEKRRGYKGWMERKVEERVEVISG